jgi:hypothetical protein
VTQRLQRWPGIEVSTVADRRYVVSAFNASNALNAVTVLKIRFDLKSISA